MSKNHQNTSGLTFYTRTWYYSTCTESLRDFRFHTRIQHDGIAVAEGASGDYQNKSPSIPPFAKGEDQLPNSENMNPNDIPPRVVIDTNLILSALVFAQGRLTPLRLAWQGKRIQPLLSKDTAAELIRVLAYPKFKLSADDQQELLADYLPYCISVVIPNPPPQTPNAHLRWVQPRPLR